MLIGVITVELVKETVCEIFKVAVRGNSPATTGAEISASACSTGSKVGSGVKVAVGGIGVEVKVAVGVWVSVGVGVWVGVEVAVGVAVDVGVDVAVGVAEGVGVAVAAEVGVLVGVGVEVTALKPSASVKPITTTIMAVMTKPNTIPTIIFTVCKSILKNDKSVVSGQAKSSL